MRGKGRGSLLLQVNGRAHDITYEALRPCARIAAHLIRRGPQFPLDHIVRVRYAVLPIQREYEHVARHGRGP